MTATNLITQLRSTTLATKEAFTMSKRTLILSKILVWIVCLYPWMQMLHRVFFVEAGREDALKFLGRVSGDEAIGLLIATLGISPLRKLIPRLHWLISLRRLVALFAFFYASLHMLTYCGIYAHFSMERIIAALTDRHYVIPGIVAWLLLLPLAVTSTKWSMRKLGARRWSALHRITYLAVVLAIVHFWWAMKPHDWKPLKYSIVLAVILGSRPLLFALLPRPSPTQANS